MRKLHKVLVVGGVSLAVLVPASAALADGGGWSGQGGRGDGQPCDNDRLMDRTRAQDGTGWRHTLSDSSTVVVPTGAGAGHQSGPMDGSGPRADRPMDGTGNQMRSGG